VIETVENPTTQVCIVGLRFQPIGKLYYFDASSFTGIQPGDFVVVETSRGTQLGQIVKFIDSQDRANTQGIKSILRIANPQDLLVRQQWEKKEIEAVNECRKKVSDLGLKDVKIVSAEFSLDGSRLLFVYSSEEGEKTDLKSLRRSLQRTYQQAKIEMHLVGPRDVAKALGGMGACGMECRCCTAFLTEFSPISIKMAKEQGISLTPTEITGMCGRLRCCLVYEYEQYIEARKQLPKRGKLVVTSKGNGKVIDVNPLKETILVELEQGGQHEFLREEIQPMEELEALQKKVESPCETCPDDSSVSMKKGKKKSYGRNR
jgi:cell fate regulator YaaT (PSP1 superfamily)